ncbi:MAG: 2-oxoisovalerate dehydrogenase E1 subunit beta [Gemmatimonadota bacterium]|nr:2-oxoisovalerate dehydrogenase E1 subunit beta [Gemmatimonadota bacterium]
MTEIVFLVDADPAGGWSAQALGASIVTEADDMPHLREAIRNAVRCHFGDRDSPSAIPPDQ